MHTIEFLKTLLRYNPLEGKFFWIGHRSNQIREGAEAGSPNGQGYVYIEVKGKSYRRCILAWAFYYNEWPSLKVDHRDKSKNNDKIDNLRLATNSQNGANCRSNAHNKLKERGITLMKGRFRVCLYKNHVQHYAGCYGTLDEAIVARNTLAIKLHGEFAP